MILDSNSQPGHPQFERNANIHSMSPLAIATYNLIPMRGMGMNTCRIGRMHGKKVKTAPVDSLDSDPLDWAHS